MLNSNAGIDPSTARGFGTAFSGQNQAGANAFGLGGAQLSPHISPVAQDKFAMLVLPTCRQHPWVARLQHADWLTKQVQLST